MKRQALPGLLAVGLLATLSYGQGGGPAPTLTGAAFSAAPLMCEAPTGVTQPRGGSRLWVTGEYLLWWIKNGPAPVPLVTSAPATTLDFIPGALGNADTTVALGGRSIEHPVQSGGRFTAGLWLDNCQTLALEGSYLFLATRSTRQFAASNGAADSTFLVNPFFDPTADLEIANFLAIPSADFPGAGAAALTNRSRLQGAELNAAGQVFASANARLSLLAGFRYLQLHEGLTLATYQNDPVGVFFPGQFVNTVDDFSTRNNFYGGQVGARLDYSRGRFFVQTSAKVALGSVQQVVEVSGQTTTNTGPGFLTAIPVTTVPGGIYAQQTNIGRRSRDRFAVAPEATVQVGMNLTRHVRAFVGYNFLYISEVARPGNQIDRSINSTQLVSFSGVPGGPLAGAPRPAPLFNDSQFWAQGINFGLGLHW